MTEAGCERFQYLEHPCISNMWIGVFGVMQSMRHLEAPQAFGPRKSDRCETVLVSLVVGCSLEIRQFQPCPIEVMFHMPHLQKGFRPNRMDMCRPIFSSWYKTDFSDPFTWTTQQWKQKTFCICLLICCILCMSVFNFFWFLHLS